MNKEKNVATFYDITKQESFDNLIDVNNKKSNYLFEYYF